MATVFDVAKYILDKYGAMSAPRLQILLFYSRAMSLVWDDVPLFEDDFEAGKDVPMCRTLFDAYKGKFMLNNGDFLTPYAPDTSRLTDEQKETINTVVDSLIDYPPYVLRNMVQEEKPWLDARGDLPPKARSKNVISKTAMLDYYTEHW